MQNFDNVLDVLRVIQKEVKLKHNKEIKISEIKEIINSQFKNFKVYTKNKEEIKIDYIGKFKIKPKREYYLNKAKKDAN